MSFSNPARADRRALLAFGLVGAGLGLGLGAAYMVAGMGEAAAEHARQTQLRQALTTAFTSPSGLDTLDAGGPVQAPPSAVTTIARASAKPARGGDLDCLTAAVYFEARGETSRGQAAVAQVVLNRVLHPSFPNSVCAVVYQGADRRSCQFSFACDGIADTRAENGAWRRARRVAVAALNGTAADEIGRATHFHAARVSPAWGRNMAQVAQIGLHVFYSFAPRGSRPAPVEPAVDQAEVQMASHAQVDPGAIRLQVALMEPAVQPTAEPEMAAKPEAPAKPDAKDPAQAPKTPAPSAVAEESGGKKPMDAVVKAPAVKSPTKGG